MSITDEQLKKITDQPLLAVLATSNPDGTPQATPLWYHYDGEAFVTTSFAHRVKVRNIKQNSNVVMVIVDSANNGRGLIVRGKAELIGDDVADATLRNAIRYVGEETGKRAAADLTQEGPRYIIRVVPDRIIYD